MAVDGALGNEQTRTNVLVAQAFGDQLRDLRLSVSKWRCGLGICVRTGHVRRVTERLCNRLAAMHMLSGRELGLDSPAHFFWASGVLSSVSGGLNRTAPARFNWAAGPFLADN